MEDGARKAVEEHGEAASQERPELPGATLRAAREAAGMGVEAAAVTLRLQVDQVEALEADDPDRFSAPIFYHGFIRNYARLLGLDPGPLLAAVRSVEPAEPPALSAEHTGAARVRRRRVAADFAGSGLIVALVVLGVGVAWMMTRGADPVMPPVMEGPAAPAAGVAPSQVEEPLRDPPPARVQGAAGADEAQARADDVAPVAAAPAPAVAPESGGDEIVLRFSGRSWVEVSDAAGRRLAVRMGEEGETLRLQGSAPFDILLGNAPNVTLEYNGSPYTDIPANRQNVANFRLGSTPE